MAQSVLLVSCWLDIPGFGSGQGERVFSKMSRQVLGPTQPPVLWVPGFFAWGKVDRA
jgi:hypothetical protein